jgi:hypothetical protein
MRLVVGSCAPEAPSCVEGSGACGTSLSGVGEPSPDVVDAVPHSSMYIFVILCGVSLAARNVLGFGQCMMLGWVGSWEEGVCIYRRNSVA